MRIAWVTHRDLEAAVGGAEQSDLDMIQRRPDDVKEVTWVGPGGVDDDLADYDRIVVTGLEWYNSRELNTLARLKPLVWVHDVATKGHWLYPQASKIIFLNQMHMDFELAANPQINKNKSFLNPGWMDTSLYTPMEKRDYALWAHRPEGHKGLDLAAKWASEKNIELKVMVNHSKIEVAEAMAHAKYFILLSHIFDAGPRSVMEAQLSGCELVVDNVGFINLPPEELKQVLDSADKNFWQAVLD